MTEHTDPPDVAGWANRHHAPPLDEIDTCTAAANQRGAHIPCTEHNPHDGWAHANAEHELIWRDTATPSSAPVDPVMAGAPVEMPRRVDLADVHPGDRIRLVRTVEVEGTVNWTDVSEKPRVGLSSGVYWVSSNAELELLDRPRCLPVVGEPVPDGTDVPVGTIVAIPGGPPISVGVYSGTAWWFAGSDVAQRDTPGRPYVVAFVPEPTT